MRWKWLRRRRWLAATAAGLAVLGWLFWPSKIHKGPRSAYIAVTEGDPRSFLGTVHPKVFPDPWQADRDFDSRRGNATEAVSGIGDEALWRSEIFSFRIGNVNWYIDPTDSFNEFTRGTPEWKAAIEDLARRISNDVAAGTLKGAETGRIPRVALWMRYRYPAAKKKVKKWIDDR